MKKKMVAKVEMAYCTPLFIGIFLYTSTGWVSGFLPRTMNSHVLEAATSKWKGTKVCHLERGITNKKIHILGVAKHLLSPQCFFGMSSVSGISKNLGIPSSSIHPVLEEPLPFACSSCACGRSRVHGAGYTSRTIAKNIQSVQSFQSVGGWVA